jgi:2-oxoacid:acceptor oxidoreductase delta subunit (pyruvate/2-ketoisovalerate family)
MKGTADMADKRRRDLARKYELERWQDFPLMNVSLGNMLHNRTGSWRFIKPLYEDKIPPCQNACPAGNDIEAWIKLLQRGDLETAYWHLKREQPFPAILGRVCFRFCEGACNRTPLDESVSIRELERFVGDQMNPASPHPDLPDPNGKHLAVVGSGPAGMSAAYFARLLGFQVTLFEELPEMGGILRVGIPAYRLPREIVQAEIQGLGNMGIQLRPHTPVGEGIPFQSLCDTYDYVFLATGVHASLTLGIEGEASSPRVMSGLDMLKRVALGEPVDLGQGAVIVGGGNTAVDAARTAVRLGCRTTLLYRRSQAEMPAHPDEVREALEEGVELRTLAAPERIDLNPDGTIRQLVCCEMELGPPDASGRRRPMKKDDARFHLETDSILTAIGETPIFGYIENAVPIHDQVVTVGEDLTADGPSPGKAKIFAGGDIIPIPHTVVHAVASGKRAAIAMDCDRRGKDFSQVLEKIAMGNGTALSFSQYMDWAPVNPVRRNNGVVVEPEHMVYDYFEKAPRVSHEGREAHERNTDFDFYTRTFSPNAAQEEAARCLHCGRCIECDNCLIFCPDVSVLVREDGRFGYVFDYDYCKGCGICYAECPRFAISMVDEDTPTANA